MLQVEHVKNCYNQAISKGKKGRNIWVYIGYLEACLVQFGQIESKSNGVEDYIQKVSCFKLFRRDETRGEIILRLTEDFLKKETLKKVIEGKILEELNKVKNSEEFINRSYLPEDRKNLK